MRPASERLSDAQVDTIVRRVASRYCRQCWHAEKDDLVQAGWEAAVDARRTFDPHLGAEAGYVWRAVTFAMRRMLWQDSSPVSGGMSDPRRLRTAQRAPLDDGMISSGPSPDVLLDELRWTERVRERALACAGRDIVALPILQGETTPREIARELRVPVRSVYAASARLRASVEADEALWLLAEEAKT